MAALWVQFPKEVLVFKGGLPQIASIITICFCSLGRTISAHCRQSTVSWEMLTSTSGIMSRPCRFVQRVENTCHQLLCLELWPLDNFLPQYHKHDLTLARTMGDRLGEAKASGNLGNTLKVSSCFWTFNYGFLDDFPQGRHLKATPTD